MKFLRFVLFFLIPPVLAFIGGYQLTERWFRLKLVPFPFHFYGIAVGLASACWTVAILSFIRGVARPEGRPPRNGFNHGGKS